MASRRTVLCALFLVVPLAVPAAAEVKTIVGRNASGTPAFRLDDVPPPSRSDAAAKAKVTLVDGTRDGNAGNVGVLTDGRVPRTEDQPRANFFFAPGTDGGRIAIDLGAPIDVRQVNTYSWHPRSRGPQVYTLYGSDGSAGDFDAAPKRGTDPEKAGWRLLAAVDTRPEGGAAGGQFAVSVADPTGTLGTYRYLLLDASATSRQDGFGNTFYSEIDVVDAAAAERPVAATPAPEAGGGGRDLFGESNEPVDPDGPKPLVVKTRAGHEIVFDYSAAPDLKGWVETKLKPVCVDWYPKIVAMLPSEGYEAPKRFTILFSSEYRGVAAAAGSRVVCSSDWFRDNLEGEAVGAVVHEMVHVVQQYGRARGGKPNPGWLVEGVADYVRWFLYEPASQRPEPDPRRDNYDDSYRATGHFLDYLTKKHDAKIVRKLNAAMRDGKFAENLWKELTGKTADELGREWKQSLPAQ